MHGLRGSHRWREEPCNRRCRGNDHAMLLWTTMDADELRATVENYNSGWMYVLAVEEAPDGLIPPDRVTLLSEPWDVPYLRPFVVTFHDMGPEA